MTGKFFNRRASAVWLAVFLGNPGRQYSLSRHNTGFMAGDRLAEKLNVKINKAKFKALWCKTELGGRTVVLLEPQTYMNLSGEAVREAADFFKIPRERVVVVFDDVSLPVGKLRVRPSGSAGGHNGIKSIISCLGGDDFPRVKIGVGGPPHSEYDMADWVLGSFSASERKLIDPALDNAGNALECIISKGIDRAMNEYN